MGEDEDFEDDSDVSSCSSERSDKEDARPRAKTVRSIIHEVGLALFEKEGANIYISTSYMNTHMIKFIIVVVVSYHFG